MTLVGTDTILGTEIEVHASKYGQWSLYVPAAEGDERPTQIGSGDTLDKAKGQARTALNKRKVKVRVEFVALDGQRGVATGLHARSGAVLVRYEDGSTEQLGYRREALRPDIPTETLRELTTAQDEIHRLTARVKAIQREYAFELASAVQRAIDEKVAASEVAQ